MFSIIVITAAVGMEHVVLTHGVKHIRYPLLDSKTEKISKLFLEFSELAEK